MVMPAPFEILRKTPKTNCGMCGYPTCLAFSAAVAKGGENPAACPYLDITNLSLNKAAEKEDLSELGVKLDLALIAHLKEKIAPLDFSTIAPRLGIGFVPSQPDVLGFFYLGQRVLLSRKAIWLRCPCSAAVAPVSSLLGSGSGGGISDQGKGAFRFSGHGVS